MPHGGNFHQPAHLQNVAVEYKSGEFIADQVLGVVNVQKESDIYYVFDRNSKIAESRRANGAPANQASWALSTSSYSLGEHALADIVTNRDRANADSPLNLDVQTTEFLTRNILMGVELEAAQLLFTTATWSLNETIVSTTSWRLSTSTTTPVQDVLSATAVIENSGVYPNTMIMSRNVFNNLKVNTDITNRIQYVERAIGTQEVLRSVFDVERLFVGRSVYDASPEYVAGTVSITTIWSDDCLVGYFAPNPSFKQLSAAYMLQHSLKGRGYSVKRWRDEARDGDMIEVSRMSKPVAVATLCAFFFKSAVT